MVDVFQPLWLQSLYFINKFKFKFKFKTRDFQQSVDRLFSHESVAGVESTNSEVKGACYHNRAPEAYMVRF